MTDSDIHNGTEYSMNAGGSGRLYRMIWRWHFYAGLFCIPFVLLLAVSGTIYLFKPQIDAWVDAPHHNLETGPERHSANQQIATALNAVPGSGFLNYQVPESESHAVIVSVEQAGKRILVYINPYTLDVLKTVGYEDQFIRQVRSLHGELMAGNTGSVLIELAGCWALVMIVTGWYLWWPKSAKGAAGVFYPRLQAGGRLFWRDLHAVTAFYVSGLTFFLLVTGLPWALVWGSAFKELRELNNSEAAAVQDWTVSRAQEEHMHQQQSIHGDIHLSPRLLTAAEGLNFAAPALLSPAKENPAIWVLKSDSQNRTLRAEAQLDAHSGELLSLTSFSEKLLLDRAIGVGIAAHEGQLFGWFNQALGLFTTCSLFLVSISGFIMWRKRKPAGEGLGAPRRLPGQVDAKVVTGIMLVMAALLPLLAVSLVALVLLEFLVLRHLRGTRLWLGLNPGNP